MVALVTWRNTSSLGICSRLLIGSAIDSMARVEIHTGQTPVITRGIHRHWTKALSYLNRALNGSFDFTGVNSQHEIQYLAARNITSVKHIADYTTNVRCVRRTGGLEPIYSVSQVGPCIEGAEAQALLCNKLAHLCL